VPVSAGALSIDVPPQSITLLTIGPAPPTSRRRVAGH